MTFDLMVARTEQGTYTSYRDVLNRIKYRLTRGILPEMQ